MARKRHKDARKMYPKFINQSITHKIAKFNFITKRKIDFPGNIIIMMRSENERNRVKSQFWTIARAARNISGQIA